MAVMLSSCAQRSLGAPANTTAFDALPSNDTPVPTEILEKSYPRALISFAGDTVLSSIQGVSAYNSVYNSEGPEYFLSGVSDIFAHDDLTIVNLECPLTTATDRIDKGDEKDEDGKLIAFWFKAPPEYVNILTSGSVEMCNLANNHILDYGYEGLYETQQTLSNAGIDYFIWDDTIVKEINGIKIGFFGFSFDSNPNNIHAVMDQLRAEGAEVIVAYFHDGNELEYYPNETQRAAAYTAIDYGASAVLESHAHVIQGIEEYNGGFIAWSLGNFCYGGFTTAPDEDSMIVQLEFVRTNDGIVCNPSVIPCSNTSTPGIIDFRPTILSGSEATRVLDKIAGLSK